VFKHQLADVLQWSNRGRTSHIILGVSCCICEYINMRHRATREVMRYTAVSHDSALGDRVILDSIGLTSRCNIHGWEPLV
jgi:acyl-[acyl carrier protein]--UDP-N-acetylglucosamine O-acyltransferase